MSGINILGSPGTGPNAPLGFLNFPAALTPIFQENMLDRKFQDFLQSILAYRECADHMDVPASIGQTLTATRPGLLQPSTLPRGVERIPEPVDVVHVNRSRSRSQGRGDEGVSTEVDGIHRVSGKSF